jgi:integrase
MTVRGYLQAWLSSTLTQSPKTLERYRELATRQIIPYLGEVKIQKLSPERIGQWHAALIAEGLAPRTVGHAHRLLSLTLSQAVKNGTLARNVVAIQRPPAVEAVEIEILSPDQIKTILGGLAGHALHPIASLALATGMRRGELLALNGPRLTLIAPCFASSDRLKRRKLDFVSSRQKQKADGAISGLHPMPSLCCANTGRNRWDTARARAGRAAASGIQHHRGRPAVAG